jgi:hypothetical protein
MSGTQVNASIPLGFHPASSGPDINNAATQAIKILQLRQNQQNAALREQRQYRHGSVGTAALFRQQQTQQAAATQAAIQNILSKPGAIDPKTGLATPDTINQAFGVSPEIGVALQKNQLKTQQNNLQMQALASKTSLETSQYLDDNYSPIYAQYKENIANGMSPAAAQQIAQEATAETTQRVRDGGLLTPAMAGSLPTQFDPMQAERSAMLTSQYQAWVKDRNTDQRAQQTDERANEEQRVDQQGNLFTFWPNRPPGKNAMYPSGVPVPPDAVERSHKEPSGTIAGKAPEDVTVDGRPTQAFWNPGDRHWYDLDGNQVSTTSEVRRISKAPVSILSPQAVDSAAQWYRATGEIQAGFGGQADRDAIQDRAAAMDQQAGISPDQRAKLRLTNKADLNSLRVRTTQRDAIAGYENGAQREFALAQSLIPSTPEPLNSQLLTQWARTGSRQFGDVPNAQFYVALTSALDEYAKVISGGTGSSAASSDSARLQALSLIPQGATTAQIKGVIGTINQGMEYKRAGYDDEIKDVTSRLMSGVRPQQQSGAAAPGQAAVVPGQPVAPGVSGAIAGTKATPEQLQALSHPATPADAMKLGAGTPFIRPDGTIGIVPASAPASAQTPAMPPAAAPATPTAAPASPAEPVSAKPTTQAQFDALAPGTRFVNPADGKIYRKKAPSAEPQVPTTDTDYPLSAPARPVTQAEFNALPSRAYYINPADGKIYRKK